MKIKFLTVITTVALSLFALLPQATLAEVRIGFLGGFTGPIESLTPPIFDGFRLAISQINAQGGTSAGKIKMLSGDTTCSDSSAATSTADRLINTHKVHALVGALCSGATSAIANNVAVPAKVMMISPSSTTPSISNLKDNDLVFRNVVSDAEQGLQLARMLINKDIKDVAVTYVNNDYGKAFFESFSKAYKQFNGKITVALGHEDGKSDYRADLGTLESSGSKSLVLLAYADTSGQVILRQAIENGHFEKYIGGDGMVSNKLSANVGDKLTNMIATQAGTPDFPGSKLFATFAKKVGLDPSATYASNAYDAGFAVALAIEKLAIDNNGLSSTTGLKDALRSVASAPGVIIYPGEWQKAKKLLSQGKDINYEGASGSLEFDKSGDVSGFIVEMAVKDGQFIEVGAISK